MATSGEKLVVGLLGTIAIEIIVISLVLPGWALWPPRLNNISAILAPLGHLGASAGFADWIVAILGTGGWIGLGAYWTWSWIQGRAREALVVGLIVYGFAAAAALLIN